MRFIENEIYHIYNRGNNSQTIFFKDENYQHFLDKIRRELKPHCEILAYCLMPNHFHIMIMATEASCREIAAYGGKQMQILARKIGLMLSSYSQQINKQRGTTGSLFQQKTKAKCISIQDISKTMPSPKQTVSLPSYIINCMHYIHQNPLKAKLVTRLEEWKYSSFNEYIHPNLNGICNIEQLLQLTGYELSTFYKDSYMIMEDFDQNFLSVTGQTTL